MRYFCNTSCKYVNNFLRTAVLWLCGLVGIAVLPEGCRAIPGGHFNFDPQIAEQLGGRDGVARAIIYEKIHGWLLHNKAHGLNRRGGQTWTYNDYKHWAEQIPFWHETTIGRHIRALETAGLLVSAQPSVISPKFYSLPVETKESIGQTQMPLWGEQNSTSDVSKKHATIHKPAIHKLSTQKRSTTTARSGAVAGFDHPRKDHELPESIPSTAEGRESTSDGAYAAAIEGQPETANAPRPSPHSALPPSDLREFFSGCSVDELQDLLQKHGEARVRNVMLYAETKAGIKNPPGFALVKLAQGWTPPEGSVVDYSLFINRGFDAPTATQPPGFPPLIFPDESQDLPTTRGTETQSADDVSTTAMDSDTTQPPDEPPEAWKALRWTGVGEEFYDYHLKTASVRVDGHTWFIRPSRYSERRRVFEDERQINYIRRELALNLGVEPEMIDLQIEAVKGQVA